MHFELYDSSQPCLVPILNFKTFHGIKVFLEDVFDIYARYLRVHMITPGNIKEVTIQFPASMTTLVQDCIDQSQEAANDTSMHIIEPQAEGTKTSETQPTAAPSVNGEAAKHKVTDMDNEHKKVTKTRPTATTTTSMEHQTHKAVHKIDQDSVPTSVTLQFTAKMEQDFPTHINKEETAKHYNVTDKSVKTKSTKVLATAPDTAVMVHQKHKCWVNSENGTKSTSCKRTRTEPNSTNKQCKQSNEK